FAAGQDLAGGVVENRDHRLVVHRVGPPQPLAAPGLEVQAVEEGALALGGCAGPSEVDPVSAPEQAALGADAVLQRGPRVSVAILGAAVPQQRGGAAGPVGVEDPRLDPAAVEIEFVEERQTRRVPHDASVALLELSVRART